MDATAMLERDRGTAAGPGQPTLVEQVLGLLPVPYLWAAVLAAAVLGPPGSLLVATLETGDVGRSLESFFHAYMPARGWQQALAVVLWTAFYVLLFWAVRHARVSVEEAEPELAPLLPDAGAFRRAFGSLARVGPPLLIGLAMELLFLADYRLRLAHAPGPVSRIYEALSGPPLYLMVGTALWVYVRALWGLYRLGRGPLELKPFYEDRTMGLRPLATLSLSLSLAYFALLLSMVLMLFIGPVQPAYVGTVAGLLALGLALFFLPLMGAHAQLRREKAALQEMVRARWRRVLARSLGPAGEGATESVVALEALERKVAAVPTWPFDLSILSRLGVMALTVAAGLATQLVAGLLGL